MMTPAVRSPQGARRVVFAMLACVIALLFLGAWVIRTYTLDRTEDQDQIVALEDAVNALVEQVKQEGGKPVVDNAAEVTPSGGIGPIGPPGRDGRDGVGREGPQGDPGVSGAVGATGAGEPGATGATGAPGPTGVGEPGPQGDPGATGGQGNPGPEGPVCPAGYSAQVRVELPSTETWLVCVADPP